MLKAQKERGIQLWERRKHADTASAKPEDAAAYQLILPVHDTATGYGRTCRYDIIHLFFVAEVLIGQISKDLCYIP